MVDANEPSDLDVIPHLNPNDPTYAVKRLAQQAVFYVDADDQWLRMQYCNAEDFCCTDENIGEDYTIRYDEVDLDTCKFYELTLLEHNHGFG